MTQACDHQDLDCNTDPFFALDNQTSAKRLHTLGRVNVMQLLVLGEWEEAGEVCDTYFP